MTDTPNRYMEMRGGTDSRQATALERIATALERIADGVESHPEVRKNLPRTKLVQQMAGALRGQEGTPPESGEGDKP